MNLKPDTSDVLRDQRSKPSLRLEALGRLTEGLAHDFNNLLTIILANLERAKDQAEDPELQRRVYAAHDAAKRGERLVKSFLLFARSQPANCRVLDLNALIRNMEPLLTHCLGPNIKLTTLLDPNAWPVETDPSQTEMAILNLAVNARDATPRDGQLRIETANVMLSGEYDGLCGVFVALTIVDTGCGMSPAVLARVFDPFFTTKPAGRGTGLGLSTVGSFAKQFRGTVTIESELGRGTSVTIYLPRSLYLVGTAEPGIFDGDPLSPGSP
jgi:signal transduction histidine kinase